SRRRVLPATTDRRPRPRSNRRGRSTKRVRKLNAWMRSGTRGSSPDRKHRRGGKLRFPPSREPEHPTQPAKETFGLLRRLALLAVVSALGGEWMLDVVPLGDDLGGLRRARDRALDRFLHGLVVVFLDLLVVGRFPVDEHADADEEVVGFVRRNGSVG